MVELNQQEMEILRGLLPRIYDERDGIGDDDSKAADLLDDVGWWIEMTVEANYDRRAE